MLILSSKKENYSSLVSSTSDNPKRFWQTVNKLLHRKSSPLPTTSPGGWHFTCRQLSFFHRQNIQTPSFSHQQPCYIISALTLSSCHCPWFLSFHSCLRIRSPQDPSNYLNKHYDSDPISSWLLKNVHPYLIVPTVTNIVNLSITSGQFHPTLKESVICLRNRNWIKN